MLHELIDRESPKCLYCNTECNIGKDGEFIMRGSESYDVDLLTCRSCNEVFEIHSMQHADGTTEYNAFLFSCKELCIFCSYITNEFYIGNHRDMPYAGYYDLILQAKRWKTCLPSFEVDFSNKDKLYEKIKTYLLFS